MNRIDDVMVSVLASSTVEHGYEPRSRQRKTMKLVYVASPISMGHYGERADISLFGIRIMCPSGETRLSADCCFNERAL
jgi:hypothetical protein